MTPMNDSNELSRRDFIKTSAAVSLAALAGGALPAAAKSYDKIRIGIVGCGRRGTGAVQDCIKSSEGVELVAMADVFQDQLNKAKAEFQKKLPAGAFKVTPETCFTGFDAYEKIMATDIDLVLLATPPHFRAAHLKAAVAAGKHVFMEKPVAVDPVGVKSVIANAELAKTKGLALVAGTQRRHQLHYVDFMKRIHDGAIGEITGAQCYWVGDYSYYTPPQRKPEWTEMEWQLRNWNYYTWLSGDHIVEQHVHNLDVINWALGTHPVKALGIGGRMQRVGPQFGHIYDHFTVEFEYPNGVRMLSMCRQQAGCSSRISEHVVGSKGTLSIDSSVGKIEGEKPATYEGANPNPYVQEHADLIASIRAGKPLNEGKTIAESTMMAILGRVSAYTGRELKWDWLMNASQLDLTPTKYELGPVPEVPVAMPGQTKLI